MWLFVPLIFIEHAHTHTNKILEKMAQNFSHKFTLLLFIFWPTPLNKTSYGCFCNRWFNCKFQYRLLHKHFCFGHVVKPTQSSTISWILGSARDYVSRRRRRPTPIEIIRLLVLGILSYSHTFCYPIDLEFIVMFLLITCCSLFLFVFSFQFFNTVPRLMRIIREKKNTRKDWLEHFLYVSFINNKRQQNINNVIIYILLEFARATYGFYK